MALESPSSVRKNAQIQKANLNHLGIPFWAIPFETKNRETISTRNIYVNVPND